MARMKKLTGEKRALKPKTGRRGKGDIEKLLAAGPNRPAATRVTELRRRDILAAAAGVFQWRLCERDSARSEAHIVELVRALRTTGSPFDPLLVFPAGDKYFVIDGHHRLTAYEAAQWNEPVPVEVFKGSFEEACLAALDRNRKDTLSMTRKEKAEAAWRLVKEESGQSKQDITRLTSVSNGTIGTMRAKWCQIKAAGKDKLLEMTWTQAKRWAPDGSEEFDAEDWRERRVQELLDLLVKTGIATEFGKRPDVVAEALCRLHPDLPDAVMMQLDWDDAMDRLQMLKAEDQRQADDRRAHFAALDAKDMKDVDGF